MAPYTPVAGLRRLMHDDELWSIREADTHRVPGAQGGACLVFEADAIVRRSWIFPPNWHELDDSALWHICERSPSSSAAVNDLSEILKLAMYRAMANIERSRALLVAAKEIGDQNLQARAAHAALLQQCRAGRAEMRMLVQANTKRFRAAGVTAEETSLLVANAVREGGAKLDVNRVSVLEFQRNADRWCASAYRVA